jgi:hypothetical protein
MLGSAGQGAAQHGVTRHGMAELGSTRFGGPRQGSARYGERRQADEPVAPLAFGQPMMVLGRLLRLDPRRQFVNAVLRRLRLRLARRIAGRTAPVPLPPFTGGLLLLLRQRLCGFTAAYVDSENGLGRLYHSDLMFNRKVSVLDCGRVHAR